MERSLLILGGSGFIGSNLADRALKEGYETHIFFNNYSSLSEEIIAGYSQFNLDLSNKISVQSGIRYEDTVLSLIHI